MNTHAEYRRHVESLRRDVPQSPVTGRRLTWVRPTELAAFASPMVGRGIDLQAELTRRARRVPVNVTRAIRHREPMPPPRHRRPRSAEPEGLER